MSQNDGRMSVCRRKCSCDIWKGRYTSLLYKSRCALFNTIAQNPADPGPFQALIGTVEELSASTQTQNLVRDQFETNYFGPLNIIKATLPDMRRERSGHVMIISGISKFDISCL
jgi:NAD(P)-dependent dehydrogenase (short-subunit alcohol dehydrogenase family)